MTNNMLQTRDADFTGGETENAEQMAIAWQLLR